MTDQELIHLCDHSITTDSTHLPSADHWNGDRGNPHADIAGMPIAFEVKRVVAHPTALGSLASWLPDIPTLQGAEVEARDCMGNCVLLFGGEGQRYLISNVIAP